MIEFQGVNKVFRKKRETIHALKDVSFKIDARDVFGVIGYSGAGKSTLVRLVNQLEQATEGHVIVDGFSFLSKYFIYTLKFNHYVHPYLILIKFV